MQSSDAHDGFLKGDVAGVFVADEYMRSAGAAVVAGVIIQGLANDFSACICMHVYIQG